MSTGAAGPYVAAFRNLERVIWGASAPYLNDVDELRKVARDWCKVGQVESDDRLSARIGDVLAADQFDVIARRAPLDDDRWC